MSTGQSHQDVPIPIRLGVCVDDFGLNLGVNEAALALVAAGRVSALSCLVDAPAWHGAVHALRASAEAVDLGLHLNLTESFERRRKYSSLGALILRAYGGRLARIKVRDAVRSQFDAFESAFGAAPDFVDGHQHVHQLPGIRDVVLDELTLRYASHRPWIRNTRPSHDTASWPALRGRHVKSRIIAALGGQRMQTAATAGGFPQNRHLLGVYDFGDSSRDYGSRLEQWLGEAVDNDLLMCHPAAFHTEDSDPIAMARLAEYSVLASDRFTRALALAVQPIVVTRLSRSLSSTEQKRVSGS